MTVDTSADQYPKSGPPLVVDLDGTLIRSDLLIEAFFHLASRRPARALGSLFHLTKGKAAFKAKLAGELSVTWSGLPLNEQFAAFLRAEKNAGRRIYLASASDKKLVEAIAEGAGIFDGIFASDGQTNLAGGQKARALVAAFGKSGFAYAGNATADIPVWRAAGEVIVVGANGNFRRKISTLFPHSRFFDPSQGGLRVYARAFRVHQWLKNLLVFATAAAGHRLSLDTIPILIGAFFSFSLCASSAYIINDLIDLPNDRSHPRKRNRPLASGNLPLLQGMILAPTLLVAGMSLGWWISPPFLAILGVYYGLTLSYTFRLKRKLIMDVLTLASLYGIRLAAGGIAIGMTLSPWFASFAIFIFVSLAIVKRCTEIIDRNIVGSGDLPGRGYLRQDIPILEAMAVATGYLAVLVFALYINSSAVLVLYRKPDYLWAICVVLFYWISRILLLMHRGEMHEDPVVYAITDAESLACGVAIMAIVLVAV